jgi:integrase/recombinase XerC
MLAVPDRDTLKGKRDYAILRLLWDNALRRGEVASLSIGDLDLDTRRLWILGKGRGSQKEAIALSNTTAAALQDWLLARRETNINKPLFIALDSVTSGHRLSTTSIYEIVQHYAKNAGITKVLSPHRIRHSSVTAALEATGGDVRRVQKLSRHANLNTLMIYDDNRLSHQGEISDLLADLV